MLCLSLMLAGCSGGGGTGSSASGGGTEATILLDSAVAGDTALNVPLTVVALERDDGQFTGNLLAAPTMVAIADPSGAPACIELRGVPPGSYRAARLLFRPDGARGRSGGGPEFGVRCEPIDHRVEIEDRFEPRHGEGRWFELRHRRGFELLDDGRGGRAWRPDLAVRNGAVLALPEVHLHVEAVDAAAFTFTASLSMSSSRLPVAVLVPESALLVAANRVPVTRAAFFAELTRGIEVRATGTLDAQWRLTLSTGRLDDGPSGAGPLPESEGRIAEVRLANREIVLVPRNSDPLVVNGKSVASAIAAVEATTLIQRVDENRVGLTLAQVLVGWRVWVKGTLGGDGRIVAALVRVRPE